jgi:hypothetical protein
MTEEVNPKAYPLAEQVSLPLRFKLQYMIFIKLSLYYMVGFSEWISLFNRRGFVTFWYGFGCGFGTLVHLHHSSKSLRSFTKEIKVFLPTFP